MGAPSRPRARQPRAQNFQRFAVLRDLADEPEVTTVRPEVSPKSELARLLLRKRLRTQSLTKDSTIHG